MSRKKPSYEQLEQRVKELEDLLKTYGSQDVKQQRQAEQEQLKSITLLETILESTDNGILVVDNYGKVLKANARFKEMMAIPDDLLEARDDAKLLDYMKDQLEKPDEFFAEVERLYAHPDETAFTIIPFKDGRIYERYSKSMYMEGVAFARIWSFRDITARKKAERMLKEQNQEYLAVNEELEESLTRIKYTTEELKIAKLKAEINEAKTKTILSAIPDMMFMFDKEGAILDCHTENADNYILEPEFFLNKKVDDVLPDPLPALTHDYISRVLTSGNMEEYNYELEINGSIRYYESRMVCLGTDKTLAIVRDVTDSRNAQQELIVAKEHAEESDRLKSAFLASMSHEIRTPMNGIIGFSEMIQQPELTEEKRLYYTKIIVDSSRQLLSIVNDVLDISLIETNSIKVQPEQVVVNDLIMDLFTAFKSQSNNKTITFNSYKSLTDRESTILTDKCRLHQVLRHLLNNAFKFTHEGNVKFGYELKDISLRFYVSDTGIGIAPEYQKKVFERFRQEDLEMTRQYGGTGLGLSISQKLVKLLGGEIWVESQKGKGSVFYFTIPYNPVYKNKHESTITNENVSDLFTILIAEDEEVNHLYLQEILSGRGVHLIHARDGKETLEMIQKKSDIDLVLMDIKMPIVNGHDATREIKKIRPNLPIIAQTACAMSEDREKALEAGCDDYLAKPVAEADLIKVIDRYRKRDLLSSLD